MIAMPIYRDRVLSFLLHCSILAFLVLSWISLYFGHILTGVCYADEGMIIYFFL